MKRWEQGAASIVEFVGFSFGTSSAEEQMDQH